MKIIKNLLLLFAIIATYSICAQVAITTDGSSAHGSAMLEVKSSDKGLLPPRMTEAERDNISSPAAGLIVWCTDCAEFGEMQVYNGINWTTMVGYAATPARTVPDAPTIGPAVAGDGVAGVTFTAPASNGGATITSYTATSNPGDITGTLYQAGSGTITITGLTNLTSYTFTVTATNSVGTSAASNASNAVTPTPDVTNPATGKTWRDRNLGASQVATSSTDAEAYGDLYQWGRLDDGHQVRTSPTTTTLSNSDVPGHGNYIRAPNYPYDWRSPQNNNLWQGVSGTNNPCPPGYRLPTDAEWNAERLSWSSDDAAGAFNSPLKLPLTGHRNYNDGSLGSAGSYGNYWSATVSGTNSLRFTFYSSGAYSATNSRAMGQSVRCIKD